MKRKRQQIPFGELLRNARDKHDISRAELSRRTGIAENSLIRYEKAGKEPDGQYPTGRKLAVLCLDLGLDPQEALLGCLDREEYWKYETHSYEQIGTHPAFRWVEGQYKQALDDANAMRSALDIILPLIDPEDDDITDDVAWLISKIAKIKQRHEDFETRMLQLGPIHCSVHYMWLPGEEEENERSRWVYDLSVPGSLEDLDKDKHYISVSRGHSLKTMIARLSHAEKANEKYLKERNG